MRVRYVLDLRRMRRDLLLLFILPSSLLLAMGTVDAVVGLSRPAAPGAAGPPRPATRPTAVVLAVQGIPHGPGSEADAVTAPVVLPAPASRPVVPNTRETKVETVQTASGTETRLGVELADGGGLAVLTTVGAAVETPAPATKGGHDAPETGLRVGRAVLALDGASATPPGAATRTANAVRPGTNGREAGRPTRTQGATPVDGETRPVPARLVAPVAVTVVAVARLPVAPGGPTARRPTAPVGAGPVVVGVVVRRPTPLAGVPAVPHAVPVVAAPRVAVAARPAPADATGLALRRVGTGGAPARPVQADEAGAYPGRVRHARPTSLVDVLASALRPD